MRTRKKIVSIRLYRFQSHIDTTINFDDISNAIVGRTDSGKSAITRALYWTLYNKPTRIGHKGKTDEFTTWGENHCFVTVVFNDGTEITRGRKQTENYYLLVHPDGTKTEFKGFGFDVPQDIIDAHGMYPLTLEDSMLSLNVSQQLDPLFMLEDGASTRAKVIGVLSGADKADGGIGIINTWHRRANNTKKEYVSEFEKISSKLEEFDFLDYLSAAIETLSSLLRRVDTNNKLFGIISDKYQALLSLEVQKKLLIGVLAYEENLITLDQLIGTITELQQKYNNIRADFEAFESSKKEQSKLQNILTQADKLQELELQLSFAEGKLGRLATISHHFHTYKSLEKDLASAARLLDHADDIIEVDEAFKQLDELISVYNNVYRAYASYSDMCARLIVGKEFIHKTEEELAEATEEYKRILAEAAICPYCNSTITEEQLEKINS